MKFRTEIAPQPYSFKVDYNTKGLFLGSCFAESIGEKMHGIKLPVTVNPTGPIYNPASIAHTIEMFATQQMPLAEELFSCDGLWRHYNCHSRLSMPSQADTLEKISEAISIGHKALLESRYVVLTLGTAIVYKLSQNDQIVCNCHKQPQRLFDRQILSVDQIVNILKSTIDKHLSDKQIILTVSPIRHIREGYSDNSLSKASLILAASQLQQEMDNVHYFPSYEIMMDELRDYRFYADDMVHPSAMAIDYIWEKFKQTALSKEAVEVSARVEQVVKALAHRPFNPDSTAHQNFIERTKKEADTLSQEYPLINFE